MAMCVLLTINLIMQTIEIKRKLVEEAIDQLKAAQQDCYVQSTQNVIDEMELALRQPPVSGLVCDHKNKRDSEYFSDWNYCPDCKNLIRKQTCH